MKIRDELNKNLLKEIFIYPTDTVYGIGCNAEDSRLVSRIRKIKNRDNKPFSVIAPSIDWILENCKTSLGFLETYFPGPYTLILEKKSHYFLSSVSDEKYLGVRIPNHDFTKKLQSFGKPIVTTSVNFSGEKPANSIEEIPKNILKKVNFIFDYGKLSGKPSTIIFLDKFTER